MVVLVGVLVVLFIVAFLLSESRPAQRWRSRHGGWYPGAYGPGGDSGDCGGSGFGGGDFGGGGGDGGGGGGG
jgi:uncharacterized protein